MNHIPSLVIDLALILGAAGVVTFIFKRLKQPMVLGYILVGFLVSPNTNLFPSISDEGDIQTWSQIGVIFLLFALGLEFSFKKLAKVGSSAAATGVFELTIMSLAGFFTAQWLGWKLMDSLFMGGILAISSTTIIFRAFEELGLKTRQFTILVMGVLVIEDLAAVLLMVVLSALAVSRESAGFEMILALGKLIFFLSLWFLLGIFLLPSILKKMAKWLNDETLLILALALCLGMVVLAENVGFSAALGAFIMGSILSETVYGEKIEHMIRPLKTLFGAIFFVSVGMLIDLQVLKDYFGIIILFTLIVVFGKSLSVTIGALIAGKALKQAVSTGLSLTQIGEFSFIIASLGISLKVTSHYLYPIAIGVSVLTTFITPYLLRSIDGIYKGLTKILPNSWQDSINRYSMGSQNIRSESEWRLVFSAYLQIIFLNSVIILGIGLLSVFYLKPFMLGLLDNDWWSKILSLLLTLLAMAPFIWALTARKMQGGAYKSLWLDSKYNHGPLVTLEIARNLMAVALIGLLLRQFFGWVPALIGAVGVMGVVLVIFRQRLQGFYHRIEHRFLTNLNEKEKVHNINHSLSPWDAHLSKLVIGSASSLVGVSLGKLRLREKYGINIAFIERGNRTIYAPSKYDRLFPYDEIGVIGTDLQLLQFTQLVNTLNESVVQLTNSENISLEGFVVDEHNGLKGKTIRQSGIREMVNGLVVGIERNGKRMLNPPGELVFEWEDVVWVVGDRDLIRANYMKLS